MDKEIFANRLKTNLAEKNRLFSKMYEAEELSFDEIFEEYYAYGQQIKQKALRLKQIIDSKKA